MGEPEVQKILDLLQPVEMDPESKQRIKTKLLIKVEEDLVTTPN